MSVATAALVCTPLACKSCEVRLDLDTRSSLRRQIKNSLPASEGEAAELEIEADVFPLPPTIDAGKRDNRTKRRVTVFKSREC